MLEMMFQTARNASQIRMPTMMANKILSIVRLKEGAKVSHVARVMSGSMLVAKMNQLMKQVGVERFKSFSQLFGRIDHILYRSSFVVKCRIGAGKVMLNKLFKAAMMELIGDSLEWRKILNNLIKPTANALTILCNEAGNAARSNDAYNQNNTIKNSAQEIHEYPIGN
jgi:hypothetical protein